MRIILDIDIQTRDDVEDMAEFVRLLNAEAERKQYQGFPGMCFNYGSGSVWVKKAEAQS